LRKSHFQLGTAPPVTASLAKQDFKEVDLFNNGPQDTTVIRQRMQKGSLQIGDEKNRKL